WRNTSGAVSRGCYRHSGNSVTSAEDTPHVGADAAAERRRDSRPRCHERSPGPLPRGVPASYTARLHGDARALGQLDHMRVSRLHDAVGHVGLDGGHDHLAQQAILAGADEMLQEPAAILGVEVL